MPSRRANGRSAARALLGLANILVATSPIRNPLANTLHPSTHAHPGATVCADQSQRQRERPTQLALRAASH
jgi:hypothetical protein